MSLLYRREIDGLRALAVVPVILFHAGFEPMSGGYVGVDVFFVISGYLITSILIRELLEGDFSILRFYERRARRILPALFVVLAVTVGLGVAIMLPYELNDLGRGLTAVVFFLSNVLFWKQSGYFAAASELNPLIHTWSLAVEEQFYVLFPPVLWLLWRLGQRWVWIGIGLAFIVSLALAEVMSVRASSANFFLLPTRAWELMAGALIALWLQNTPAPSGRAGEALALGGVVAIMLAIGLFDAGSPFPSLRALLPVLGTVAIILGASPNTVTGRVLGWRGFVGVGLISYSAYLWHQPLFAFARLTGSSEHLPPLLAVGLIALTFALAWATWVYVERPFRQRDRVSRQQVFALSGLGSATILGLAGLMIATQGLPQRFPADQRNWIAQGPLHYSAYVEDGYRQVNGAPLASDVPNLVLVGDSFSQDLYNILREHGAFEGYAVSALYLPARCQIHYGIPLDEALRHIAPADRRLCAQRHLTATNVAMLAEADVVFFAASWRPWSAQSFAQSLAAMSLPSTVQTLVLGPKVFESRRRALLDIAPDRAAEARVAVQSDVLASNDLLRTSLPPETFIDILGTLCAEGCPLFTDEGAMISYDGSHLTQDGARFLGDQLFVLPQLASFARRSDGHLPN